MLQLINNLFEEKIYKNKQFMAAENERVLIKSRNAELFILLTIHFIRP